MSSLLNKAKDKIEQIADRNSNSNQADNPHSSNAGPHSSNFMNKGDPRVDSDRDHRNDPTSRVGGVGNTQEYTSIHGQTTTSSGMGGVSGVEPGYGQTTGSHVGHTGHAGGLTGHNVGHSGPTVGHTGTTGGYGGTSSTYDNPQSANVGPHSSNMMNKLDPRVDSDVDNRGNPTSRVGGYGGQGESYGHTTGVPVGHSSTGTTGVHGGSNTYNNPQSANVGPHGSNLANKIDPRVDSDVDNRGNPTSRVGGYGGQGEHYSHTSGGTGVHGGQHIPGTTGVHSGHGAPGNTGAYGSGAQVGGQGYNTATPGSGNAPNTAGPHNSDLLNKLDPRVDADLDGSKTYGGNATYR